MKRIRVKMLRTASYFLAAVLSIFGLESCSWGCEYGTPHADLNLSGTVTDKNNMPIKGIRVDVETGHSEKQNLTNENGQFSFKTEVFPLSELRVIATDIDSLENGLYLPDTVLIHPTFIKNKKDEKEKGNWYDGRATIENIEIKMDKKE